MALMCIKPLVLNGVIKSSKKNINVLLGPACQCLVAAVNYSQNEIGQSQKLSKAMNAYLENSKKYDEFLKEQIKEYELGKKFLAGMMGNKDKEMTQQEVDKAVEYLFPSSLFNRHSRPKLKHPEEVFQKKKPPQFDFSGRPFHFLYYTTKPNYSEALHEAAEKLRELQVYEHKLKKAGMTKPEKSLTLEGEVWLSDTQLQKKFLEKIQPLEYEKFIELLTRLAEHPYSYMAEGFIKSFRRKLDSHQNKVLITPVPDKDGITRIVLKSRRKTSIATVKVSYPGSGKIQINNSGLDYFLSTLAREQVVFPLLFTEMENRVDVEATVESGGEMSQAGAVRYGIAKGLKNFVSEEMAAKMKLAGLLQRDLRRTERKKVGREGARRGYTWLKR